MKDAERLPDAHYKITELPDKTFNVYFKIADKWELIESGFLQVPFCAEKFILRKYFKSNEWERHRISGQDIKQGINTIWCIYHPDDFHLDWDERRMLTPEIIIDCSEVSKKALLDFSHGYFEKYLNDKQDWLDARKKYKSKCKGRLLALDELYLNCPRSHPNSNKNYAASNKYQGTQKASDDWDIIKKQDINFQDYTQWVNRKSANLFDWREYPEIMNSVHDITVEYFKQGKSANTALRAARKNIRELLKEIKD